MNQREHTGDGDVARRVEKSLRRCVKWSQQGSHRRVLNEVERARSLIRDDPRLEAQVLGWKAQALLALGCPERALPAATRSWELEASPHSCHLMSVALHGLGEADRSVDLLRMGCRLYPDAVHIPLQLAMILADQGRVPEAIDTLDQVVPEEDLPEELQVFMIGLQANLLASVGRWRDADGLLREAMHQHPEASLLQETQESLQRGWMRSRAERSLASSWRAGLEPLDDAAGEVDDAVIRAASVLEMGPLHELGARRLWRALVVAERVRPQALDAWAAALLAAVAELDGDRPSLAAMARALQARPATARSAAARVRRFISRLEDEFARRSFAASSNPRLDETPVPPARSSEAGTLVHFPSPDDPSAIS